MCWQGDLVIYTTGEVRERDKNGFIVGQACMMSLVVDVKPDLREEEAARGTMHVVVNSKPFRSGARAFQHALHCVPPALFDVPGGGPCAYFYRLSNGKQQPSS